MNSDQYLLICLIEECSEISQECMEIAQRATKVLRFGIDETQPGKYLTNRERLLAEIANLMGTLEAIGLTEEIDRGAVEAKKEKIRKYMKYSEELGILKPEQS
jgi:hypothetical protein